MQPIKALPSGAAAVSLNIADDRVDILDRNDGLPVRRDSVSTGLAPVSVRMRRGHEA